MKKSIYASLIGILFGSCNYINPEVVYEAAPPLQTSKKVLLEVYTGVRCTNCPGTTKLGIDNIKKAGYYDNIIIMKIHGTFFAEPMKGLSKYDFKTTVGNKLIADFGVTGLPTGVVNRKSVNGSYPTAPGKWITEVDKFIKDPNYGQNLTLEPEIIYSDVNRKLSVKVSALANQAVNEEVNLLAYITEDSIVDVQLDREFINPDPNAKPKDANLNFVHVHVLRDQLQSSKGDLLFPSIEANALVRKTFTTFTLPEAWRDTQCSVVIVATKASNGEVIQVEEIRVVE